MPYQPRATFDNPYGPQVTFRTEDILPPAAYYVGLEDQIVWNLFTNVQPATFFLLVRMLNPQGVISVESATLSNAASGAQQLTANLTGMEGYILSACVSAPGVALSSAFCTLRLMRAPDVATGITTGLLTSGFVSDTQFVSYPTTVPSGPLEGPAQLKTLTASPAAGQEWKFTCPLRTRWQVMNSWYVLTTSATVATRYSQVFLADGASQNLAEFAPPTGQTASSTLFYSLNPGGPSTFQNVMACIGCSAVVLIEDGGIIGTATGNLQPGDQYSAVRVQVQEWVGLK